MSTLKLSLFLPTLLLLGACSQQFTRMETRLDEIYTRQLHMEAELGDVSNNVQRISAEVEEQELSDRERRAQLENQLRTLDRLVRQMDARDQETEDLLRRISATLDLVLRQPGSVATQLPLQPGDLPAGDPASGDTAVPDPAAAQSLLDGSLANEVYDSAFADFTRGNYSLARSGFQQLLQSHSASELADDAAYWIAESYYGEGKIEEAKGEFESILQKWPQGDTRPATLLKLGYCNLELNGNSDAARYFQMVIEDFPQSDEALIAEHKLSSLNTNP